MRGWVRLAFRIVSVTDPGRFSSRRDPPEQDKQRYQSYRNADHSMVPECYPYAHLRCLLDDDQVRYASQQKQVAGKGA